MGAIRIECDRVTRDSTQPTRIHETPTPGARNPARVLVIMAVRAPEQPFKTGRTTHTVEKEMEGAVATKRAV